MDDKDKREFLKSYRDAVEYSRQLRDELKYHEYALSSPIGRFGTSKTKGTKDLSDWAVKHAEMEQRLIDAETRRLDIMIRIWDAIDRLEDDLMRLVIFAHYLDMQPACKIAKDLRMSHQKVRNSHWQAIKLLQIDDADGGV